MNNKLLIIAALMTMQGTAAMAQRHTDTLDRGLVAVKTAKGVFCSWRIPGSEYYDVTYNIYKDGKKLNDQPLLVSNYTDTQGTLSDTYTVSAVVRGVEQAQCEAVKPWAQQYLDIPLKPVYGADGKTDITSHYAANDVSVADLTGDGKVDLILKRVNTKDVADLFPESSKEFTHIEAYTQQGDRLWWIDCGPNMVSGSNVEVNAVAYDWDEDGKAEVLLRGADGMVLHTADGQRIMIGDSTVNTRNTVSHTANMTYTNTGAEYLLYLEGATGKPYQIGPAAHPNYMDYPLTRGKASDWGDSYGHRSSKYFFGAPFLDGRHASIFLARGIYTKHKMIAFDVDHATHQLKQRWYWTSDGLDGTWFGNGYHNFGIADVDWDGRDEIVYGSMVIDDDGKGLSTTGLGHGDAQHCSDFNPYIHGQEIFTCNETRPNNNYRDATTSKIYYRTTSGNDDGRAMMGNFTDDVIGAQGITAHDAASLIGGVCNKHVDGTTSAGVDENFNIYWDGDLLEETINGDGTEGNCVVHKYGSWTPVFTANGTKMCNWTKNTPSSKADILGDWREELILRSADDLHLRIYTTVDPTPWRNYTLWDDPQYRNGMVWEMCGYNQPPHVSYFLGKAEGITVAPPPITNTGRTEVSNGSEISTSLNDKQVMLAETNDMQVSVAQGAQPYILYDNAPSWVQGNNNNNNIVYTYYTHKLTGAAFSGSMRLVKQGDGTLQLPDVEQTYTGNTDVWAGTLVFNGNMKNSPVWLNRFARLNSNGGTFPKGITMLYGSQLLPGGENAKGTLTTDTLRMQYGAELVIDVYADSTADLVKAKNLVITTQQWPTGPTYQAPVVRIVPHYATGSKRMPADDYLIAEIDNVQGPLDSLTVEGIGAQKSSLVYKDGKLYLNIADQRDASTITWSGANGSDWDLMETDNFKSQNTGEANNFVTGDKVIFDDNAAIGTVNIKSPLAPASITFENNLLTYTLTGDSIIGTASLTKNGEGVVNINNVNRFTGGTTINGGRLNVATLANTTGNDFGSLGSAKSVININGGTLGSTGKVITTQPIVLGEYGATFYTSASQQSMEIQTALKSSVNRSPIIKEGPGTLTLSSGNAVNTITMKGGTLNLGQNGSVSGSDTIIFVSGTVNDPYTGSIISNSTNYNVTGSGSLYLDPYCNYNGKLVGDGTFTVYAAGVRNFMRGDWSKFTGTLNIRASKRGSYDPVYSVNRNYGLPYATVDVGSGVSVDADANGARSYTSRSYEVGNLTGSGSLYRHNGNKVTLTVGRTNQDFDFQGVLDGISLVKMGSGNWLLSSKNNQEKLAALTIKGGELRLQDTQYSTAYLSGLNINVTDSGAIKGRGCLTAATLQKGALLAPGYYLGNRPTGKLVFSSSVNAAKGSTVSFCIVNNKNSVYSRSFLEIGGNFVNNATVKVNLSDNYTPEAGDSIVLWTCSKFAGTPALELPELPQGLEWDTSSLLAPTGVLKIKVAAGISAINSETEGTCKVFNAQGALVATVRASRQNIAKVLRSNGVPEGVYLVRIAANGAAGTFKVTLR